MGSVLFEIIVDLCLAALSAVGLPWSWTDDEPPAGERDKSVGS